MVKERSNIRFVLVRPRSPGNVGSTARVLKNFGFSSLYLVEPRLYKHKDKEGEGSYFEVEALRMAYKSEDVLKSSKIVNSFYDAIKDVSLVIGTDPFPPKFSNVIVPEELCDIVKKIEGEKAIVFGTESDGLTNEELSLCHYVVKIPTDEKFVDLNLSHSVAIIAYLLFRGFKKFDEMDKKEERASVEVLNHLLDDFVKIGLKSGFLKSPKCRMVKELKNIILKSNLNKRSAGILRSLAIRIKSKL